MVKSFLKTPLTPRLHLSLPNDGELPQDASHPPSSLPPKLMMERFLKMLLSLGLSPTTPVDGELSQDASHPLPHPLLT